MTSPIPPNESGRLEALRRHKILDTASEQTFDEITALAAHICIVPMAIIGLVASDRVWYKFKVGLTTTQVLHEKETDKTFRSPGRPEQAPPGGGHCETETTLEGNSRDNTKGEKKNV